MILHPSLNFCWNHKKLRIIFLEMHLTGKYMHRFIVFAASRYHEYNNYSIPMSLTSFISILSRLMIQSSSCSKLVPYYNNIFSLCNNCTCDKIPIRHKLLQSYTIVPPQLAKDTASLVLTNVITPDVSYHVTHFCWLRF